MRVVVHPSTIENKEAIRGIGSSKQKNDIGCERGVGGMGDDRT